VALQPELALAEGRGRRDALASLRLELFQDLDGVPDVQLGEQVRDGAVGAGREALGRAFRIQLAYHRDQPAALLHAPPHSASGCS
jgi:hypothetical protein